MRYRVANYIKIYINKLFKKFFSNGYIQIIFIVEFYLFSIHFLKKNFICDKNLKLMDFAYFTNK